METFSELRALLTKESKKNWKALGKLMKDWELEEREAELLYLREHLSGWRDTSCQLDIKSANKKPKDPRWPFVKIVRWEPPPRSQKMFSHMAHIKQLQIYPCGISSLKGIEQLQDLRALFFRSEDIPKGCNFYLEYDHEAYVPLEFPNLTNISVLGELEELEILELVGCSAVEDFGVLERLTQLRHLNLSGCMKMRDFDFLRALPKLKNLNLSHTSFDDLSLFEGHTRLKRLELQATKLKTLDGIENIKYLQKEKDFRLVDCKKLKDANALKHFPQLEKVNLRNNRALQDISGLEALRELQWLDLGYCRNLEDISVITAFSKLSYLDLRGATKVNIKPFRKLLQTREDVQALQKHLRG